MSSNAPFVNLMAAVLTEFVCLMCQANVFEDVVYIQCHVCVFVGIVCQMDSTHSYFQLAISHDHGYRSNLI